MPAWLTVRTTPESPGLQGLVGFDCLLFAGSSISPDHLSGPHSTTALWTRGPGPETIREVYLGSSLGQIQELRLLVAMFRNRWFVTRPPCQRKVAKTHDWVPLFAFVFFFYFVAIHVLAWWSRSLGGPHLQLHHHHSAQTFLESEYTFFRRGGF